jgi:tetratricopeptide (TPR) repeat protein
MNCRALTAACFIVLLSTMVAPAHAPERWTTVQSKNFFLIGNAGDKDIRQVAQRLEQFREVATRLFTNDNVHTPVPTRVIVFRNDNAYRPFKTNASTTGYFQPGLDVNYITLEVETSSGTDPLSVIFHEYTHLLVNNTKAKVPTWFNEGLAEYYSTFAVSNDHEIILGRPVAHHVNLLRHENLLPLKTLLKVDQQSAYYNERDKQGMFYAESWALMHYLILGNNGQRFAQLNEFLRLLEKGGEMEQAFKQAFQTTFAGIERELRDYIAHDRFPVAPHKLESKLANVEMKSGELSEAEVQAYLGDLLLHCYRTEAESYLQKALQLDPKLALAHASIGMLRVREGKLDEARQSLKLAVESSSQNYLIHYYYAYALSREGMTNDQVVLGYHADTAARIREELKQAIALQPEYPESYNLLAFVNLVTQTNLDESITLLKRAIANSPARNDLLFTLAQAYMRKLEFQTARQILEKLIQNRNDDHLRDRAEGLLKEVSEREHLAQPPLHDTSPRYLESLKSDIDIPYDPADALREALRKPGDGERQVLATLMRIDCDGKGIIFTVMVEGRLLRLHADQFRVIHIVAFSSDAGSEITCGPRKTENIVVICYVPETDLRNRLEGRVKSIEFVPKDFKLKT